MYNQNYLLTTYPSRRDLFKVTLAQPKHGSFTCDDEITLSTSNFIKQSFIIRDEADASGQLCEIWSGSH